MRKTRFQGCSEVVQIDPDSNDRASGEIAISNFHYDSDTDSYDIKNMGSYNPYIAETMHICWDEIQCPNGELTFADSKPKYRDCSYLARDILISPIGKEAGIDICFSLILLVCVMGFFIWKSKPRKKVPKIKQKFSASSHDAVCLISSALDIFTMAAQVHEGKH